MPRLATSLIFAKDAQRLARFYEAGFGFPVLHTDPEWIVLDAGGAELGVHQIPPEIAKDIAITDPPRERSQSAAKLIFAVEDFAAAKQRLETAGARFRTPNSWDGETARDFVDPEGNVFRIQQPSR
jgi:catechol 2,3-dioxygenase-like lactoylglutathione lyase family enzyme